ncbi:MAG: CheR family methyltransferase [Bacteroidales bacterium]
MEKTNYNAVHSTKMSVEDFRKLSRFITEHAGIKMPEAKKVMLQSRLQKRLRYLDMDNFKDYVDYVFSEDGIQNELIHMLDVVSTNKTDFFREPVHFEFLEKTLLPEYIRQFSKNRPIKIWSAGCSSGEEAYTAAITLAEFKKNHPGLDYSIFGTDISTEILRKAVNAIYKEEKINNVPIDLKKKYFLKSKDRSKKLVRVVPELRNKTNYARMNLMDSRYDLKDVFDVIFCRNVLIYFNRDIQEAVINKLTEKLRKGGYFFIGHSESIMGMGVPLKQIKPTIFQRI